MVKQEDVTPVLEKAGFSKLSREGQAAAVDSLENIMTQQAKAQDSTLYVSIDAFYEGNQWIATTYQQFDDLRLVFTVPKSMGKFGGETDNWMWPRQTCDFSVFRIYADPRPMVRHATPRTTFPIIPSTGLLCPCRAIRKATSP